MRKRLVRLKADTTCVIAAIAASATVLVAALPDPVKTDAGLVAAAANSPEGVRVFRGIPFGAPHGILTDIFFLICCQDDRTHLRVLARLSRLLLRPGFIGELRDADTPAATWQVIAAAERDLCTVES